MLKALTFAAVLVVGVHAHSAATEGSIVQNGNRVRVKFTDPTTDTRCSLKASEIRIRAPHYSTSSSTNNQSGEIDVRGILVDELRPCRFGAGPSSGTAIFKTGSSLPDLIPGTYVLKLEGAVIGSPVTIE